MKSKIILSIFLVINFAFLPIIFKNFNFIYRNSRPITFYNIDIPPNNEKLKIAAISAPIYIDGDAGWYAFKLDGNCTGEGTYFNPYVIEDLIIHAGYGEHCISIENSNVFFRIENCTLSGASGGSGYSGIKLYNVANGWLVDNYCFANGEGIYLEDCVSITIIENNVNNNYNGIHLDDSHDNVITGNNASGNDMNLGGIMVSGNDNIITDNILTKDGITLGGNDNTLSGNIMIGCGLSLWGWSTDDLESHHIDKTNLVNGKPLYYYSNQLNLDSDDFFNAGQVILVSCNNSKVSNLNVSYTSRGISFHSCNYNEISGNIANNNLREGIYLEGSRNNEISGNSANNCSDFAFFEGTGISLYYSDQNTISYNTANNNYDCGIYLLNSDYNLVSNNIVENNYHTGIYSYGCECNTISENNAKNNWNGIRFYNSFNSSVAWNTANRNENGIVIQESTYNEVSKNIVINNTRGMMVVIDSDKNDILENNVNNNVEHGIWLALSSYNKISRNTVSTNYYGIYLQMLCNNNTITENMVYYNVIGIKIEGGYYSSYYNKIYLNCIFENNINAIDDGSENQWDNGVKGNYWSDYNSTDANGNGIGDVPYNITGSAGSKDNFPLMKCPLPLVAEEFPWVMIILISTVGGGAILGVAVVLLIRRKRRIIE
ncbi:MAG: NosD domain-containing protein [Candidatus Thorarchaeota archaeon]